MAAGLRVGGRYRLDEVLGAGGMGVVWRAYDERLHRSVAVKEIRYPSVVTAEERADLTRRAMIEARSAARLDHPGIVPVYDVVEEDARPWIVMRLVEGRSLDQVVRADGPLAIETTAKLGLALVDALTHAHAASVVHRDVKPSNVLVQPDGRVLLTDFSIALVLGVGTVTKTGVLLGSPGYIAPERMLGGATGPAADLFGLGATLYFAVEGRGPFDAAEPLAGLFATANQPHPRPVRAGALEPVLDGLLAKAPGERLTTDATRAALKSAALPPAASAPADPMTPAASVAPTLRDVHILTTAVATPLPLASETVPASDSAAADTVATPADATLPDPLAPAPDISPAEPANPLADEPTPTAEQTAEAIASEPADGASSPQPAEPGTADSGLAPQTGAEADSERGGPAAVTVRAAPDAVVDLGATTPMTEPLRPRRLRTRRAAVVAAVAVVAVVVAATMLGGFLTRDTDGANAARIEPSATAGTTPSPMPSPTAQNSPSPTAAASASVSTSPSPRPKRTSPSPRRTTRSPTPRAQAITAKLTLADSYLTANCDSSVTSVQTKITVAFTAVTYPVDIEYRVVGGRYGPWKYQATLTSQTKTFSLQPTFDPDYDYTYHFYVEVLSPTTVKSTAVPLQVEFCPS